MHRTVKGDAKSFFSLGRSRDRNRGLLVVRQFKESEAPRPGLVWPLVACLFLYARAGRSLVAIRPCVRRYQRARYSYFPIQSKGRTDTHMRATATAPSTRPDATFSLDRINHDTVFFSHNKTASIDL